MQIRPFAELEAEAKQRYKEHFAAVPPPKIVNLDTLIHFGHPRTFEFGGVGYRAPPLGFAAGYRIMVAANALRDLREGDAPAPTRRSAARVAASLVVPTLSPIWWRFGWRIRLRRVLLANLDAAEDLLWFLQYVPDDGAVVPPSTQVTIDCMDGLADFVRSFPRWVGPDGQPLTWSHYVYGMRHLGRARSREDLRHTSAVRMAGADKKDYTPWHAELRAAAGW
jgi:hypothetical protein